MSVSPSRFLVVALLLTLPCAISALQAASRPAANLVANSVDSSSCSATEPQLGSNRPNLFTEQQEQWLGEAMAAQQEPDYTLLPEKDSEFLTQLGQKLLAQLPPTQLPYHFRVYESSELNGFSLAGGYVYLSRKLITDAKSEDEVAGVLSHEIGHIYTHQIASAISREMKRRLNLSSFAGRDDVWDEYQRMFNAQPKERENLDESEAEKDEIRADAVGLYAMMRAGYAPQALSTNLERIADSKGRNGNFLSDIMDATSEVGMRVRTAQKIANGASEACKRRELKSSAEFLAFQQAMIAYPVNPLDAPTPGLTSVKLDSPIRPGLNWVRFSPDGKYVLAQNETYVHVMSAGPLKELFKVYAPGASGAHFTPDAKHLVFHFQSLRVEDWDLESGKRIAANEIFEYRRCWQSELSPDGKVLACVFRNRDAEQLSLELFDVASGKVVFAKDEFFIPDWRARVYKQFSRPDWDPEYLGIAFSPDSRYLVVAGGTNKFAVDLTKMQPVTLHLGLASLAQGRMAFTAPDRFLYDCQAGQREIFLKPQSEVCLVEFPSGVPVKKITEGWEALWPAADSNYLVAGSMFDSVPHLVDLEAGKPTALLKFAAADVRGKTLASESGRGGITVGELGAANVESVDLPEAPLPYVRSAHFSPDGRYLALSNENRGAIWDLSSNHRMMLTRSLRGAWFDGSGGLYIQVADSQARPGQNLRFDIKTGGATETGKYEYERLQLLDVSEQEVPHDPEMVKTHNIDLQVYDDKTGNLLWKRHFAKDAPDIWQEEPGVLILTFGMEKETAWDEIAHSSPVMTSDETKEKHQGTLVEMVDSQTGTVLRQLIAPEGSKVRWGSNSRWYESSVTDDRTAAVFGDLVAVHGNENNTVVYDAKSGARLMAFWGQAVAGDAKLGLIAVTNREQEVTVYNAATGKELMHVALDHKVRAAHFVLEKKQLLVVTSNQTLYTLDVSGNGKPTAMQAAQVVP
jgi:WD40 repeat protein